jgi:hypothetical protein
MGTATPTERRYTRHRTTCSEGAVRLALTSALGLAVVLAACFTEERDDDGVAPGIYTDTDAGSDAGSGGDDTGGSEWGGDGGDGGDGGGDGGDGGGGGSNDSDGDGYTTGQGDCDDNDASINPGVWSDGCDGEDEDCDGLVDEDFTGDIWEPNDDGYHYYVDLGDITGQIYNYTGYMNPESDVDTIYYYVEDGWLDSYGVNHTLYAPATVDVAFDVYWLRDSEADWSFMGTFNDSGTGGDEMYDHDGGYTSGDSGWFLMVIYSMGGESCTDDFLLEINASGDWW